VHIYGVAYGGKTAINNQNQAIMQNESLCTLPPCELESCLLGIFANPSGQIEMCKIDDEKRIKKKTCCNLVGFESYPCIIMPETLLPLCCPLLSPYSPLNSFAYCDVRRDAYSKVNQNAKMSQLFSCYQSFCPICSCICFNDAQILIKRREQMVNVGVGELMF